MAETFISPREPLKADHLAQITPMGKPPRPMTAVRTADTMSRASRPSSVARSVVAFGSSVGAGKSRQEASNRAQSAVAGGPRSSAMISSKSHKGFGIPGYLMHKCEVQSKHRDEYTIKKDGDKPGTGQSFINTVQKQAGTTPGSNAYFVKGKREAANLSKDPRLAWSANNGCFHRGGPRRTFTDEAATHSKKIPASSFYFGKGVARDQYKVTMGKISKAATDDFLTTIMKREKKTVGPSSYKPKVSYVQTRVPEAKLHTLINEKKGWKPVKQDGKFDYEMGDAKKRVMQKTLSCYIGKDRAQNPAYERVTYCTEIANKKKFVPGMGAYQVDKCLAKINTPYLKKRL